MLGWNNDSACHLRAQLTRERFYKRWPLTKPGDIGLQVGCPGEIRAEFGRHRARMAAHDVRAREFTRDKIPAF